MAINAIHPQYKKMLDIWTLMEDSYGGPDVIKSKRTEYLRPTAGMIRDGFVETNVIANTIGNSDYEQYLHRAVYPEWVIEAVEKNVGLIHLKRATFEVPERMKPMLESINGLGESIWDLHMRINTMQMYMGRLGLMLTIPSNVNPTNPLPHIVMYNAKNAPNWSDGGVKDGALQMVTLDESGEELNTETYQWEDVDKYRVLRVNQNNQYEYAISKEGDGTDINDMASLKFSTVYLAGKPLDEVPFVFLNSKSITPDVEKPPLAPVARQALTTYRGEADYRFNLHNQGDETLVIIGGTMNESGMTNLDKPLTQEDLYNQDEPIRTGSHSAIEVDVNGDAKYIGVSATGLSEQRLSIKDDRDIGTSMAGQIVKEGKQVESGESLSGRLGSHSTTLNQISVSSVSALEKLLKIAAKWLGEDPDLVRCKANQDFSTKDFNAEILVKLAQAKAEGIPLADETIHRYCKEKGFTILEFEEEVKRYREERKEQEERAIRIQLAGKVANDPNENGKTNSNDQDVPENE